MKIEAKIKNIGEPKTYGESFVKREILVETKDKYPQTIPIEFHKDMAHSDSVLALSEGDDAIFYINIRGNQWKDRHFIAIVCWKVENVSVSAPASERVEAAASSSSDDLEDMPF